MKWEVAITSVPRRYNNLCADTKVVLQRSGFEKINIALDGWAVDRGEMNRTPRIGAYGNFVLTLWEMWFRNPKADRYAIFQDDISCSANLCQYLETCGYPDKGYMNLYTDTVNEKGDGGQTGWYKPVRSGLGALGYVFDNGTLRTVLKQGYLADHALKPDIGKKNIDGAVYRMLNHVGYQEYVHHPSLLQHRAPGHSVIAPNKRPRPLSTTFRGEEFDCLELLKEKV